MSPTVILLGTFFLLLILNVPIGWSILHSLGAFLGRK